MNLFNHIINIVRARKAKAVVKTFMWYLRAHSAETMTSAMSFYQSCALHVVEKTEENEQPLTDLVLAMDAVLKHYGPGLVAEFEVFARRMDEDSYMVNESRAAFNSALDDALKELGS